ncbi:unnamed protein product, partial [Ixodes pacificus]
MLVSSCVRSPVAPGTFRCSASTKRVSVMAFVSMDMLKLRSITLRLRSLDAVWRDDPITTTTGSWASRASRVAGKGWLISQGRHPVEREPRIICASADVDGIVELSTTDGPTPPFHRYQPPTAGLPQFVRKFLPYSTDGLFSGLTW